RRRIRAHRDRHGAGPLLQSLRAGAASPGESRPARLITQARRRRARCLDCRRNSRHAAACFVAIREVPSMRCEVVAVGTELLLGQIVDTNSAWIGAQLAQAGIDSYFQTKVGDNLGRIVACIRLALERSDAVIMCGGLGPTQDDITREAIAQVMGVPLVRSPELVDKIRGIFAARG